MTGTLFTLNLDPGTIIAGRYEVVKKIGSGGMGMVFKALDRELRNEAAVLKLLHPHLAENEEVFKRFLNEVLVARSLSHPNIVRIHDIGKTETGIYYISMEYIDGYSLKDRCELKVYDPITNEPLPQLKFDEALRIICDVATGVAYAHERGIIHRDLKPANVLMNMRGEVKLADFGTARIVGGDTSLTQTGQVIGTPDYMSPEQIRGEALDSACDIYSLGIMSFELATRRRPFVADAPVAVAFKHLSEPLPDFATPDGSIPKWFEALVKSCAAKLKTERPRSAIEFLKIVSENAPHLGLGGVIASAERTATFRSAPKEALATQIVPTPEPIKTISPVDTVSNLVGQQNTGFVAGEMNRRDAVEWRFDADELRRTGGGTPPPPLAQFSKRKLPLPVIALSALLLAAGGGAYAFRTTLFPDPALPRSDRSTPSSTREVDTREKRALEDELLASLGSSGGELSTEKAAALVNRVENTVDRSPPPTSVTAAVEVASTPSITPNPTVTPTLSPTAAPTFAPTPQPVTPPVSAVEPVRGKLIIRRSSETNLAKSLNVDEIDRSVWTARVSGISSMPVSSISEQFSVSAIFSRNGERVTRTIEIDDVRAEGGREKMVRLHGPLAGLAPVDPGTLRLRLMQGSEQVAVQEMKIEGREVAPQIDPATGMPSARGGSVSRVSPGAVAPSSNGLPAASGGGSLPVTEATSAPIATNERYSGFVTLPDETGSRGALTLDLQFEGHVIRGTGSIAGQGDYKIEGEVLPRGYNFYLKNPTTSLRFTSGRSDRQLRGTYAVPGDPRRLNWEAARSR
ncbi:MAG: serine/threonine protein kinase [Deltaproteobacteria bacterium]|nr:serine/threonine protein kinase [Deltaproteobacteria bacterium]